ncbi:MAG: transketolase [Clostridiales bacterium]|nr:transketolase [Clostridiales bacterium]
MEDLKRKANLIRQRIVNLVYDAGCGHIGGDLSVTDILVTLYYKHLNCSPETFQHPDHDRFILSKGHCVEALYCVLADQGYFPQADLHTYAKYRSNYIGHPNNKIPGIEMNSGSLGHGLSVAVGMALAGKMDEKSYRVYTVMGDGELAEGSVWEGAMAAGHYKLDNLIGVVDRNRLQISGPTETVMAQDSQEARLSAFGWHVLAADGNDTQSLDAAFEEAKSVRGQPVLILARTVKGKGISFMENQPAWHHKVPDEAQYRQAMEELRRQEAAL